MKLRCNYRKEGKELGLVRFTSYHPRHRYTDTIFEQLKKQKVHDTKTQCLKAKILVTVLCYSLQFFDHLLVIVFRVVCSCFFNQARQLEKFRSTNGTL